MPSGRDPPWYNNGRDAMIGHFGGALRPRRRGGTPPIAFTALMSSTTPRWVASYEFVGTTTAINRVTRSSLYQEPHSTGVGFDRCRRRTSLAQIVSQISTTTCELIKLVINSGRGWGFIMIGQQESVITLVGLNGNESHRKSKYENIPAFNSC
ncbi:hypothetical protein EVAR_6371_1 [Eumeta japonica]|uniref:Uncharacterized protein n=1 Tax=Eumeta variegata TaxID=151549 RepID=A0A4C1TFV9_EUMVA|nr:hypothetical protein EVAR_6371_1 [Eumeta japonica]